MAHAQNTQPLPQQRETFMTPAEASAAENFKNAAKLGGVAALGMAHVVASAVAERRERREGRPITTNPINLLVANGILVSSAMGAHSELKVGLAKRRAIKHQQ
jgi:hypothetical protein